VALRCFLGNQATGLRKVSASTTDPSPAAQPELPLIGRAVEIGMIVAKLDEVAAGRGGLVLLSGEPGIGKTRLAMEAESLARSRGFRVLWARCWEGRGAPAYWPWIQILRDYVRSFESQGLSALVGPGAAYVAQLAPALGEIARLPTPLSLDSDNARFLLFDAMASLFVRSARCAPMMLVLDDVYAADRPSLLLLEFLSREVHNAPLLIVATYREAEVRQDSELNRLFSDLSSDALALALQGMSRGETHNFIEQTFGVSPAPGLAARLHSVTAGNPFFMAEVFRSLGTDVAMSGADVSLNTFKIPDTVREAIRRHLRPLSAGAREIFLLAAVAGMEFEIAVLRRVAMLPMDSVLAALDEGRSVGIVVPLPDSLYRYRFSHALVRETLYEDMNHVRR
jgi:predicted ATPase